MGKKKKKVKVDISVAPFSEVKKDLVKKLSLLSEKKLVIIGATAVLRLLSKDVFGLIVTSKKLCSPLFHEINLICDVNKIPVLSIEEEFIKEVKTKANRISVIGIKKNEYAQDKEFEQYVLKLQKKKKSNELDELQAEVHAEMEEMEKNYGQSDDPICKVVPSTSVNYDYQIKNSSLSCKSSLTTEDLFILLKDENHTEPEFPTYKPFSNVENLNLSIKNKDALSFIVDF